MGRPRFQIPDYPRERRTVPDFRAYYASLLGYTLRDETHVVFEDGNIQTHHVRYAASKGTRASRDIHEAFLELTPTQRRKVVRGPLPKWAAATANGWYGTQPCNLGHCPHCGERGDLITWSDDTESRWCTPCGITFRCTWNYRLNFQVLDVRPIRNTK